MAGKINKGKVIASAQKYVQKGQYDKAIREYSKVVEEDPRDVRIWLKIGDLYAKKGVSDAAVDTYLKVAEFYSEQGFYLKAVAVYKQILKLNPMLMDVNLRLAEFYKQLGFLNDAMRQYELVSQHFLQAGRTKDALVALRQIVDLDPVNVASRIKLAELYSKEQMREEAIEEFSKASDFLRANNRIDDFIKVAERLAFHQPENIGITKELASLYLRRNDPRRALPRLQTAFKADPRAEDTLEMLAQAFRDLGQVPKTVSVWKELAQIHAENGQAAKRLELFRRILELIPDDADAQKVLQEAQGTASPASVLPPRPAAAPPPPLPQRGAHSQGPEDFRGGEGQGAYDNARQGASDYPVPGASQGQDPGLGGTWDEAERYEAETDRRHEKLGATASSDAFVENEFAYDRTTAPSAHGDALRASPQDAPHAPQPAASAADVESLDDEIARVLTEADVYIKYGLHDKAIDHLRSVFVRDPNNLEVRLQLKDLHTQLGRYGEAALELYAVARDLVGRDPRAAAQYLNEALELDPQNNAARQLLREIEGGDSVSSAYGGAASGDGYDDGYDDGGAIDLDINDIVEEIPIDSSDVLGDDLLNAPYPGGYEERGYEAGYGAGGSGVIEVRGETIDT
ncbi:MAG: tetratricopeptide repeat protein, partial [Deltaproteobacteria bacterium]|nr:tetratricopeptide repeat protein [Deltaproteobacteria bacterium]